MDIATHGRLDGSYLIVLAGELDFATADKFRRAGLAALATDGCSRVLVDMMDVSFIDCAGISALVAIRTAAVEAATPLVILDPSDRVARLLQLTDLERVFDVEIRSDCRALLPAS
jgi:anti-anti-sigma factor